RIDFSGMRQFDFALVQPQKLVKPCLRGLDPEQLADAAAGFFAAFEYGPARCRLLLEDRFTLLARRKRFRNPIALAGVFEFDGHLRRRLGAAWNRGEDGGVFAVVFVIEEATANGLHETRFAHAIGAGEYDDAVRQFGQLERADARPVTHNHSPQTHHVLRFARLKEPRANWAN